MGASEGDAMTQIWDAMTIEERLSIFSRVYPFDYLLSPQVFRKAALQSFENLPEITRNALSLEFQQPEARHD